MQLNKENAINISHVFIPFDKIEEILGLPDTAHVVAVNEHENGRLVVVRVVADRAPADVLLQPDDSLSKIGDAFRGGQQDVVEGTVEPEDEIVNGPVS